MKLLILSLLVSSSLSLYAGEHYNRALELYKEGPSKAPEIISELDLELHDHSDNVDAYILKAIVQVGTNDPGAALKTLDEAEKLDAKTGAIHQGIHYLRAKSLYEEGDFGAARKALEPYSAFFASDPKTQAQYDQLMAAIEEEIKKAPSKNPADSK